MPDVVKVTLNGDTLIDISDSTVEPDKVLTSYVAYEGDGDRIVGTASGGGGNSSGIEFTATYDEYYDIDIITCNKSFSEVYNIITSGHISYDEPGEYILDALLIFDYTDTDWPDIIHTSLSVIEEESYTNKIDFEPYAHEFTIRYNSNGTIEYIRPSILAKPLPTPSASKGEVSNNTISITPTVRDYVYIDTYLGSKVTGTPVTVSASELVSGTSNITLNGTFDVTNYASAFVSVASGGTADYLTVRASLVNYTSPAQSVPSYAFYSIQTLQTVSFSACTTIEPYAFYYCRYLGSFSFPSCVTISDSAFTSCISLTSAYFPEVKTVGQYAFAYCVGLNSLSFPKLETIGSGAFNQCGIVANKQLSSVYFPEVKTVNQSAFYYCSYLQSVDLPSCTFIGGSAFINCTNLVSISIPKCTSMGPSVFCSCSSLQSINLPSVTAVGSGCFAYCYSLSNVSIPELTTGYGYMFRNCSSLLSASLPKLGIVQSSAFGSCWNLSNVYLSAAVAIYSYAFTSCYNLLSLYVMSTSVCTLSLYAFTSTPIAGRTTSTGGVYGSIYVPSSLYDSYISATNWVTYSSRIVGI